MDLETLHPPAAVCHVLEAIVGHLLKGLPTTGSQGRCLFATSFRFVYFSSTEEVVGGDRLRVGEGRGGQVNRRIHTLCFVSTATSLPTQEK